MKQEAKKIIDFIDYAEKLKVELRHASKSDDNRESVADHCWRLSLMIVLVVPKLQVEIDFLKILKMAIIHDLVEIESKDIPILEYISNKAASSKKQVDEEKAINKIKSMLGSSGKEIYGLWFEFEKQKTVESKVLKALDKLEGQLQFLNESVATFTNKDQVDIAKLFKETSKLSKIDPFIAEMDEITLKDRKNRIKY